MITLKAKSLADEWVEFKPEHSNLYTRHPSIVTKEGNVVFIDVSTIELVTLPSTEDKV